MNEDKQQISNLSDKELHALWEKLIKIVHKFARVFSYKGYISKEEINDLVHDVIVSIAKKPLDYYQQIDNFDGFIYRVVRNKIIDSYRKKPTIGSIKSGYIDIDAPLPLEISLGENLKLSDILASDHDELDKKLEEEIQRRILREAIAGLPNKHQFHDIIELYLQGYKIKGIAKELQSSPSTISHRLSKIREILKHTIENQVGVGGAG